MGNSLVDKAAAHTLFWMGQVVIVKGRRHQTLLRQSNRHTGSIAGDPAAAPLLGYISSGTAAAGNVQNQVTGIGGHQYTTLNDFGRSLNNINYSHIPARIIPCIGKRDDREIIKETNVPDSCVCCSNTICFY